MQAITCRVQSLNEKSVIFGATHSSFLALMYPHLTVTSLISICELCILPDLSIVQAYLDMIASIIGTTAFTRLLSASRLFSHVPITGSIC